MEVIELVGEMQSICEMLRRKGKRIRFIPTMGALHNGHASLIKAAACESSSDDDDDHGNMDSKHRKEEDVSRILSDKTNGNGLESRGNGLRENDEKPIIIVSIFTNPMQFNNVSDYEKYPKTNATDLELCKSLLVDYVFMPTCEQIYPKSGDWNCKERFSPTPCPGNEVHSPSCVIEPPTYLDKDLEGKSRKGHFKGMLTIVCKLFNIIRPHEAYFGEKDYQQMVIVKRMVRDLNMNISIRPITTVRDSDMLPLSSRNVRMNVDERKAAPFMYKILEITRPILESMNNGNIRNIDKILLASLVTIRALATEHEFELVHIDYLQLRCSNDFSKIDVYQDRESRFFDCQEGCVRKQLIHGTGDLILKTRLLISCFVGRDTTGTRLLDNIEVRLNTK